MAKMHPNTPPCLRAAIEAHGDPTKLARAAGVGVTTMRKNCSGETKMSFPTAIAVHRAHPEFTIMQYVSEHYELAEADEAC